MMYFAASVMLQIICAVHVIRSGRPQLWLMVIFFFSVLGCFAYFVMEVLPAYRGNRYVRAAQSVVQAKLDPEGDLRRAEDALALADTAANHISRGDALMGLDRPRDAVVAYRTALAMVHGDDPRTTFKLAQALFDAGNNDGALSALDQLGDASGSERDRHCHLRARALAGMGRTTEARELFEDVITRLPGDVARCHFAAMLIDHGDRKRALAILQEVNQRAKRLDRLEWTKNSQMYRWAEDQLSILLRS